MAKTKADEWMDSLRKVHTIIDSDTVGIEIIGRIVLREAHDMEYVTECLEKLREYGSAEITKWEKL